MSVRLEVLAEEFVNGPDNGTEEALERLLRAVAAGSWDEGWRAGRGRGPGHTEACPIGGSRHDNPYRRLT